MVAATADRSEVRKLFEGLVPAEVIDAYERLLASGGCAKNQAGALAGNAALVRALTNCGMAHVVPHSATAPA